RRGRTTGLSISVICLSSSPGRDTLAGARYSTSEPRPALTTRLGPVSIRTLALATRPANHGQRSLLDSARSRYARWRSLLDQRTTASAHYSTRPGLDTLAGARYSTSEPRPALTTRPANHGERAH